MFAWDPILNAAVVLNFLFHYVRTYLFFWETSIRDDHLFILMDLNWPDNIRMHISRLCLSEKVRSNLKQRERNGNI